MLTDVDILVGMYLADVPPDNFLRVQHCFLRALPHSQLYCMILGRVSRDHLFMCCSDVFMEFLSSAPPTYLSAK